MNCVKACLSHLLSIKAVLIASFILLMAISGTLGFVLTYFQSQQSLNDVAVVSLNEAAHSVVTAVTSKLAIGHQLNHMELLYFLRRNVTLDNFVTAYYEWKYLALQNLMTEIQSFILSTLSFLPANAISVLPTIPEIVLINFNSTVCNDTVHFPGSSCNVPNYEGYYMDPKTGAVDFTRVLARQNINVFQQVAWVYGALSRTRGWRSSEADLFSPGYTIIFNTPSNPTFLAIQLTAAVVNSDGYCIGSLGTNLLLDFVNTLLSSLVNENSMLQTGGRAFVYEQQGLGFVGASHGSIDLEQSCATCAFGVQVTRYRVDHSNDSVISAAGSVLWGTYQRGATAGAGQQFTFDVGGEHYLHISQPLTDAYGLRWMVSVVLSLTELFRDITAASMRMLGITAGVIVALSVVASLGITYVVVAPLRQLALEMEEVAHMRLDGLVVQRSRLSEVSVMQGFFVDMISKLSVYRTFLPEAILPPKEDETDSEADAAVPAGDKCASTARLPIRKDFSEYFSPRRTTRKSIQPTPSVASGSSFGREGSCVSFHAVGTLTQRQISCMYVDVAGFHRSMALGNDSLVALHSELTEVLTRVVQEHFGMCNPMLGDKLVAVWNVKSAKAEHATHCATAALEVRTAVMELQRQHEECLLQGVRVACTAGPAYFGPMGTKTTRVFTVVAPCITHGFALQKFLKVVPVTGVVCNASIFQRVQYKFLSRLVAVLPGMDDAMFELLSASTGREDEWMYELKEKENIQSRFASFELGVRALFSSSGTPRDIRGHFESHLHNQNPVDRLAQWYVENMEVVRRLLDPQLGILLPLRCIGVTAVSEEAAGTSGGGDTHSIASDPSKVSGGVGPGGSRVEGSTSDTSSPTEKANESFPGRIPEPLL